MNQIYINPETGEKFSVSSEKLDQFLQDFPNAVLEQEQEQPEEVVTEMFVNPDTEEQFKVSVNKKDQFLKDFPNAIPIDQAGKETSPTLDAVAGKDKASDMDLPLEDGLSELKEDDGQWDWGIVDYFSDLARAAKEGWRQGELADDAFEVINKGADVESKDILKFLKRQKEVGAKNIGSDEMRSWQKTYDKNGKSTWGAIKGILENPSVLSTLLVSSLSSQLSAIVNSGEVLASGVAGAAAGAGAGAAAGAIGGPLATLTAAGGALTGAMTGSMAAMETGLTFGELLQEQVGDDLNDDAIKEFLNDPERLADLKNKALKRGLTIGAIEGLTLGVAKGVGSKLAKAGFKKMAIGTATGVIEAGGGSLGEVGGRYVAGQEMDPGEIVFEGVAGFGGAPLTLASQASKLSKTIDKATINKIIKDTDYKDVTDAFKTADVGEAEINIAKIKNSTKILDEQVDSKVESADITEEEGNEIKLNFRKTQQAVNKISSLNFPKEEEVNAVSLLKEKETLENKIKEVGDSSLTTIESDRVDEINKSLSGIRLKQSISFAEKQGKKLGLDVEVLSQEEYDKKFGDKAKGSEGVWDKKNNSITINKDRALEVEAVSVGSHELLHGILSKGLKGKDASKIVEDFKNILSEEQKAVVDKRIKENYTQDYLDKNPDEYLTVFSDAITKKEIKFEENLFTKIGDFITPILRSVGFKNIKFNTGKDVYNFMREYQKSVATGELSKDIIKSVELKDTEASEGLATSITDNLNEKVDNLVGKKDESGNYQYKSKTEFQSSPEFVNVYDKIISGKMIDPLIRRGIEGDQVYGKPVENFIEEVKDGLTEVLMRFDPTENNSLIGFINSQLKFRKGDVLKKYKAQQTKSIDTAAGEVGSIAELEAEDTSEALLEESMAEERRQSDLIKAEEIIGSDDFVKAAKEEVASKLDQVKPGESTFKNVKGLVADTLAKEIGIPAKKIMDTTANMSSQEMGVSINWIKQNANMIAKIMPQGAVLDSASEKLLGTATGIANSILKNPKLYTKDSRIKKGAGLSPFVKNKNITGEDVLNAVGIVDGEPKPGIGPRTPEGQAVKGVLAMYEKLVSNSLLRQELIEQGESSNIIQDIGAGKGDLMFSMSSEDIKLLNEYDIDGYKLESKADINKYISDLRKLIPLLNTDDFKILNATVLQFSNLDTKELVKYLQSELKKLSKSKELTRFVTISRTPVRKQFGSTFEELQDKIQIPGYVEEYNDKNSLVFEKMWYTINDILSDSKNKDLAVPIVTFLANSQIEKANPHRLGAPLIAYELSSGRIDSYEHAMPSVEAYRRLIKAALDPNIDFFKEFDFVKNNYKLMAITKETDLKLLANGSNSFFDPKWKNWWQRYFNDKVAKDKGGIDPNNIISIENKISLAEEFNIDKEGNEDLAFSKNLNREFNDILQTTTGVDSKKTYSKIGAEMAGSKKGRFDFFIPPGAEDFIGLIYKTLGKGEIGDMQLAWYKKNFFDPYARAMAAVTKDRVVMAQKFKDLRKELKIVPKNLRKKLPGEGFTQEQAVRVYIWTKQGEKIPGLNEGDLSTLNDYVNKNPELKEFGNRLIAITGKDAYVGPREGWTAGTITTDLLDTVNGSKRAMHLEQWQDNVDAVFTEENLNKLEALYGKSYRVALENILKRMKSGRNRLFTSDSLTGRFVDWISNSIGSIMFFNSRSAILQTISSINFINFTDNNIIAASKALANPKQFASDFMTLMNSEFLVDRRNGLRINVNEADIANIAATSKNKAKAFISEMLKLGFLPTQIADSFAIASGGAAFYRNRINTYLKQGLNEKSAEQNAMRDFREIAEESQQSSRPDKISQQQAGPLGRIILAFANTPAQYARIIKKAALDLKNGRGDRKTNISKIVYYGVAQNLLFSAMQNALFALMFDGDDDEEKAEEENKKYGRVANSMADSLLRGMGFAGAVTSVVKNAALKIVEESNKDIPKYEKAAAELIKISPPISSKLSKVESALRSASWDRDKIKEAGLSIDNPAYMIGGKLSSAALNIPLDRALTKVDNIQNAMSKETEIWQKFALLAGWQSWELGIEDEDDKTKRGSTKRKTSERKTVKRKTVKRNK